VCRFAEFLTHGPCLRQVSDDYENCSRAYQQKIEAVNAEMKLQDRWPTNDMSPETYTERRTICW
jgi:metal-sulfur cluster biosynthetic enzyme